MGKRDETEQNEIVTGEKYEACAFQIPLIHKPFTCRYHGLFSHCCVYKFEANNIFITRHSSRKIFLEYLKKEAQKGS